jgi:hypothetical protein
MRRKLDMKLPFLDALASRFASALSSKADNCASLILTWVNHEFDLLRAGGLGSTDSSCSTDALSLLKLDRWVIGLAGTKFMPCTIEPE